MFFSMLAVIVISITFILITRSKPGRSTIKQGGLFATVSGVMNALTNLLVMTVSINMPLSVVSPFVSAGGILITALFAFLFFREKLSMRELVGLVVGTVSVVFLCL
jgi:drug/metabolite transporter (DMT)-like permease